jgi:hypothetical protein
MAGPSARPSLLSLGLILAQSRVRRSRARLRRRPKSSDKKFKKIFSMIFNAHPQTRATKSRQSILLRRETICIVLAQSARIQGRDHVRVM